MTLVKIRSETYLQKSKENSFKDPFLSDPVFQIQIERTLTVYRKVSPVVNVLQVNEYRNDRKP